MSFILTSWPTEQKIDTILIVLIAIILVHIVFFVKPTWFKLSCACDCPCRIGMGRRRMMMNQPRQMMYWNESEEQEQ